MNSDFRLNIFCLAGPFDLLQGYLETPAIKTMKYDDSALFFRKIIDF